MKTRSEEKKLRRGVEEEEATAHLRITYTLSLSLTSSLSTWSN